MKKVKTDNIQQNVRRQPVTKVTLEYLQQAYTEAVAALTRGIIDNTSLPIRLYGCELTVNSGTASFTAGAIFYNGEIFLVNGLSGPITGAQTIYFTQLDTYDDGDPVVFSDSNSFNVHLNQTLVANIGPAGSGLFNINALGDLGDQVKVRIGLADELLLKANVKQPSWINLPLVGGATASSLGTPQFMRDTLGFVHLRGGINKNNADTITAKGVLPEGYRPAKRMVFRALKEEDTIQVDVDGDVLAASIGNFATIDGVSFLAEK